MKKLMTVLLLSISTVAMAQKDSLSTDTTINLNEVTVNGVRIIQQIDRQVYIPSKTIVKHSSNGYELLSKLSLNGIRVNVPERKISSVQGGNVQIRINDVKAESQDIVSLLPDEVIRVEYIDNPGVRYSDTSLDAVINYVVKRRYSGYVGGASTMQAFTTGFNNTDAYFKFNYKKSEFSINYYLGYREYTKRRYSSYTNFFYPDGTQRTRNYVGLDSPFMYADNDLQIGYNLAEPDKYTLNIRFKFSGYNSPKRGTNMLAEETGEQDLYLYNKSVMKDKTPVFDIYYSLNLPHNQNLALNAVGTYIGSDYAYKMREYLYDESAEQSMQSDPLNDYSYSTDGNKYSLITEGIYSKTFDKTVLSAGGEYTVSHTNNDYTGWVNTDAKLNSQNLYFFAQAQGKLGKLNYLLGLGANNSKIHQGDIGFNKWTFRPQLTLSIKPSQTTTIRLSGNITQSTPSLSSLSEVRQQSDELLAYDGNSSLKPWWNNRDDLSFYWNTSLFNFRYSSTLLYSSHPVFSTVSPEIQDNGSYIFISKPENQKSLLNTLNMMYLNFHAIKDVLDICAYGAFSTYRNEGNDYLHKYNSWWGGGSVTLMLGNWDISYSFETAFKSMQGETISGGENDSSLDVNYRYKGLRVGLGVNLLGYAQGYDYYNETRSKYFRSIGHTYIKDNGNMIYINLSYNFNHGRKYNAGNRLLNNSDNDNGIR